jgi:hypothetical protein
MMKFHRSGAAVCRNGTVALSMGTSALPAPSSAIIRFSSETKLVVSAWCQCYTSYAAKIPMVTILNELSP